MLDNLKKSASKNIQTPLAPPLAAFDTSAEYEHDFYAWTQAQAKLLAEGKLDRLDLVNLAEEIESMGRSDKREIKSHFVILVLHLLKYQFQPAMRSSSWAGSILEARRQIDLVMDDSPSLKPFFGDLAQDQRLFDQAVEKAVLETGLSRDVFPQTMPYSAHQLLDKTFFPA
jgi:hypothetical protein